MTRSSLSCLWIKLISSSIATNIFTNFGPQESGIQPHHLDLLVTRGSSPRSAVNLIDWLSGCWLHDPPCNHILLLHAYWWYSGYDYMLHVTCIMYPFPSSVLTWGRRLQNFYINTIWFSSIPMEEDNTTEIHSLWCMSEPSRLPRPQSVQLPAVSQLGPKIKTSFYMWKSFF